MHLDSATAGSRFSACGAVVAPGMAARAGLQWRHRLILQPAFVPRAITGKDTGRLNLESTSLLHKTKQKTENENGGGGRGCLEDCSNYLLGPVGVDPAPLPVGPGGRASWAACPRRASGREHTAPGTGPGEGWGRAGTRCHLGCLTSTGFLDAANWSTRALEASLRNS